MVAIEELAARIREVLARHPVVFAYVFGSRARGDDRPGSDLDVAVFLDERLDAGARFKAQLAIGRDLEVGLGKNVDVVVLNEAPLLLAGRIVTEGHVVLGHDEPARVRYEVTIFPRYVDFDRFMRRLDAELLAAIAAGRR